MSLPLPRIASPTARNSSAFSLWESVGDSPVEPTTKIESEPLSVSQEASSWAPSRSTPWSGRNGVTIAVTTDPYLPATRSLLSLLGIEPPVSRQRRPMLAPHAAHLHEDRR